MNNKDITNSSEQEKKAEKNTLLPFMKYQSLVDQQVEEIAKKETLFTFIPEESQEYIIEKLKDSGVYIMEPDQILVHHDHVFRQILPDGYAFNIETVQSISIEEILLGEFHIQIIGKEDQQVVDLEVGEETSGFEDIPQNWVTPIPVA